MSDADDDKAVKVPLRRRRLNEDDETSADEQAEVSTAAEPEPEPEPEPEVEAKPKRKGKRRRRKTPKADDDTSSDDSADDGDGDDSEGDDSEDDEAPSSEPKPEPVSELKLEPVDQEPEPEPVEASPGTRRVKVVKPFTFNRADLSTTTYHPTQTNCGGEPGEYEMTHEDADHWWVQAHLENPPPPIVPPTMGSPRHLAEQQSIAARRARVHAAIQQEEQLVAEEGRAERMEKARKALGDTIEQTEP